MPSILITRPRSASEPLALRLEQLGYTAVIEPLLAIAPTHAPRPAVGAVDAVMITSGNVFPVLDKNRDELSPLLDLPCFCVGLRTAEKARARGFRHVRNTDGGGGELARLVGRTFAVKKASLLHIAGSDVDAEGHRELEGLGHRITAWPVYTATPAPAFSAAVVGLLKMGKLDAAVVFSPRTAETLAKRINEAALEACCAGLAAICLSEAVADVLRPFAWRSLVAAPAPTEDAVITCLQKICPVKT